MADAPSKLAAHINAAEPQLSELQSLLTCTSIVAGHLCETAIVARQVMGGDIPPSPPEEALAVLLNTVADRVDELRSWYRQLHELGVVQARENSRG